MTGTEVCPKFVVRWLRELRPGCLYGLPGVTARGVEELGQALMGVHALDWMNRTLGDLGGGEWLALARQLGIGSRELAAFGELWLALDIATQARLWDAAADEGEMEALREETQAATGSGERFRRARELDALLRPYHMGAVLRRLRAHADEAGVLQTWRETRNADGAEPEAPAWLNLRDRIAAVAAGMDTVEVQLPFVNQPTWLLRREWLARATARFAAAGIVQVDLQDVIPSARRVAEQALPAAWAVGQARTFEGLRVHTALPAIRMERDPLHPCWNLLAFLGLKQQAEEWWTAQPEGRQAGECALQAMAPAEALYHWLRTPTAREPGFVETFRGLKNFTQAALRAWLPALHGNRADVPTQPTATFSVLAYALATPSPLLAKYAMNFAMAERTAVERAWRSVARAGGELMTRLRALLPPDDPGPRSFAVVMATLRRNPKTLAALLAADAGLVQDLLHLGLACREQRMLRRRDPAAALGRLQRSAAIVARMLEARLARIIERPDAQLLAAWFIVAGAAALPGARARVEYRAAFR